MVSSSSETAEMLSRSSATPETTVDLLDAAVLAAAVSAEMVVPMWEKNSWKVPVNSAVPPRWRR